MKKTVFQPVTNFFHCRHLVAAGCLISTLTLNAPAAYCNAAIPPPDGVDYVYDDLHRLARATYHATDLVIEYSYDSVGNLLKMTPRYLDTDNDGIPDYWEKLHGLNPLDPSDANGDLDDDGLTNLDEFLHRTNPSLADTDGDGLSDGQEVANGTDPTVSSDACPNDPAKIQPGICGCGVVDTDSDGDGIADCLDGCPSDPAKTALGACGCGMEDLDADKDGIADCIDPCPKDPTNKDTDADGLCDGEEACPVDPNKIKPGICGCGTPDTDSDEDGTVDCQDACPMDPNKKTSVGQCGCGIADEDTDKDGLADCIDPPNFPPELSPVGDIQGSEGLPLALTLAATDQNAEDTLTYRIDFDTSTPEADLPAGASFDTANGVLSWTPEYDQSGNYVNVEVSVMDNGSPLGVDAQLITITIGDVNRPPVFVQVGTMETTSRQLLSFQVEAADPDGDTLTYATANLPYGAVFNPDTRTFSWTPAATVTGTYVVTFTATDNGTPSESGSLDVAITVDSLPPAVQAQNTVADIIGMNLNKTVESSYLANMKKVAGFIESGKITPAINQVRAFATKVSEDITTKKIDQVNGEYLQELAQLLLDSLN